MKNIRKTSENFGDFEWLFALFRDNSSETHVYVTKQLHFNFFRHNFNRQSDHKANYY